MEECGGGLSDLTTHILEDAPPVIITDGTAPGHFRWSYEEPHLTETYRWLKSEFEWAVAAGLCRNPEQAQDRQSMLGLWINNGEQLPWHIDREQGAAYPDIHIHISGAGMKVAHPVKSLKLHFSDNEKSPNLQLPGLSLIEIQDKNPVKALRRMLDKDLRIRGVKVCEMLPGQVLFFNEKCLHRSAAGKEARVRALIF